MIKIKLVNKGRGNLNKFQQTCLNRIDALSDKQIQFLFKKDRRQLERFIVDIDKITLRELFNIVYVLDKHTTLPEDIRLLKKDQMFLCANGNFLIVKKLYKNHIQWLECKNMRGYLKHKKRFKK